MKEQQISDQKFAVTCRDSNRWEIRDKRWRKKNVPHSCNIFVWLMCILVSKLYFSSVLLENASDIGEKLNNIIVLCVFRDIIVYCMHRVYV